MLARKTVNVSGLSRLKGAGLGIGHQEEADSEQDFILDGLAGLHLGLQSRGLFWADRSGRACLETAFQTLVSAQVLGSLGHLGSTFVGGTTFAVLGSLLHLLLHLLVVVEAGSVPHHDFCCRGLHQKVGLHSAVQILALVKAGLVHDGRFGCCRRVKRWLEGLLGVGDGGLMHDLLKICLAVLVAFVADKGQLLRLLLHDGSEDGLLAGLQTAVVDKLGDKLSLGVLRRVMVSVLRYLGDRGEGARRTLSRLLL